MLDGLKVPLIFEGSIHLSPFHLSSLIHLLIVFMFFSGPTLGYIGWILLARVAMYGDSTTSLSGQPVPTIDHPFSKEIFPNIQSKPLLTQLGAISSHPIACHLGEEADPHLSTTSFQDANGFLGHLGTLLAHVQPAVNQHPQVLFCRAAFEPLFPKPVALHGVAGAQEQDPALGLVKPHTIDLGPLIQPVPIPLQSLLTLKKVDTPTQFGVICKFTEGALNPLIQIVDKDTKQDWPQN
ncbi:hypothetical protein QYF61_017377 [Mycteria americana]|uniref:Uncharacterized protein n=1 Tax=Mycteria americana TaxID=33587 RepID=A0AAN7P171_MYCAM|nr:hypothetical protein QYF61_017377 [Mycteria americana]